MWLKRLVAITMIVTLIGMNLLVLLGLFGPKKESTSAGFGLTNSVTTAAPAITISVDPVTIGSGGVASINWSSTNNPESCVASGSWSGNKTISGSESTGRKSQQGTYTYTLDCVNEGGTSSASATLTVTAAGTTPAPSGGGSSSPSPSPAPQVTYCGGRSPCFGPKDVAARASKGNCYGWNGDQVFNVTSLDAQYHKTQTGIPSIETNTICGKDLGPALKGQLSVPDGPAHAHKAATIQNTERNMMQFFVGYFDANKP